MSSNREFVNFVIEQLGTEARSRPMMGEYLVYFKDKLIGGIHEDQFLVKDVEPAAALFSPARRQIPYAGAKAMLVVEDLDDRVFLAKLAATLYDALPAPKPKKNRKEN